jgi:hypothetical protein
MFKLIENESFYAKIDILVIHDMSFELYDTVYDTNDNVYRHLLSMTIHLNHKLSDSNHLSKNLKTCFLNLSNYL